MINYSASWDRPIIGARSDRALRERLRDKLLRTHVVVAPTGVYASHSPWIQEEMDLAIELNKPILAIDLRGAQRTSSIIASAASEIVGWNSKSVVNGIWRLYHHVYRS